MLVASDHQYWAERAETELARARDAHNAAARKAHYELAGLYLNLVHGGEPPRRFEQIAPMQLVR